MEDQDQVQACYAVWLAFAGISLLVCMYATANAMRKPDFAVTPGLVLLALANVANLCWTAMQLAEFQSFVNNAVYPVNAIIARQMMYYVTILIMTVFAAWALMSPNVAGSFAALKHVNAYDWARSCIMVLAATACLCVHIADSQVDGLDDDITNAFEVNDENYSGLNVVDMICLLPLCVLFIFGRFVCTEAGYVRFPKSHMAVTFATHIALGIMFTSPAAVVIGLTETYTDVGEQVAFFSLAFAGPVLMAVLFGTVLYTVSLFSPPTTDDRMMSAKAINAGESSGTINNPLSNLDLEADVAKRRKSHEGVLGTVSWK